MDTRNLLRQQVLRVISGVFFMWMIFFAVRFGERGDYLNAFFLLCVAAIDGYVFWDSSERINLMRHNN